tara:strand:- start:218 stop:421 length:204 start_codon:yes stop_codon:yes gene_type:complete
MKEVEVLKRIKAIKKTGGYHAAYHMAANDPEQHIVNQLNSYVRQLAENEELSISEASNLLVSWTAMH